MRKILLFIVATFTMYYSFAQNTLEVTDSGNITRERWRDSLLRMDKNQVPTGFLYEYSMFGFESNKYDGLNNDDDTIENFLDSINAAVGILHQQHQFVKYLQVKNTCKGGNL